IGRNDGMTVTGSGHVSISGTPTHPTRFTGNGGNAISVVGSGALTIRGVPNGLEDGTVVIKDNYGSMAVMQNPTPAPPPVDIDGLVATGATSGQGIWLVAGSHLKLRNSVLANNEYGAISILPTQDGL